MRVYLRSNVPPFMMVSRKGACSDYNSDRLDFDTDAVIEWEDDKKQYREINGVTYSRWLCYSPISPYGWEKLK